MAYDSVDSINAHIKKLEDQRSLIGKRDEQVEKVLGVLRHFAAVLTPAQRRKIAKVVGATVQEGDGEPKARKARKAGKKAGRKLGKVAPRYSLPTGEVWAGRGLTPNAFSAWSESAEGKAWHKANPDEKYPPASGKAAKAKPAKKSTKKASKRAVKSA